MMFNGGAGVGAMSSSRVLRITKAWTSLPAAAGKADPRRPLKLEPRVGSQAAARLAATKSQFTSFSRKVVM